MRQIAFRRLRRLTLPVIAGCVLMLVAPGAASAASPCANGDSAPGELSAQAVRAATLCLLNGERAAHGLRPLRENRRLQRAARRHSRDMVAHRYFAHDSRSGARFSARIARTGWMRGRSRWHVGENLAWGSGARATPRAIVAAWMDSLGHRRNVLQPRFRRIGIGIVLGVPVAGGGSGATYTTDFGS